MTITFKLPNHHICLANSEKLKKKKEISRKFSRKFGGKFQITFGQLKVFFEPTNWEIGRVLHIFEKINFWDVIHLRKMWKFTKWPLMQNFT